MAILTISGDLSLKLELIEYRIEYSKGGSRHSVSSDAGVTDVLGQLDPISARVDASVWMPIQTGSSASS